MCNNCLFMVFSIFSHSEDWCLSSYGDAKCFVFDLICLIWEQHIVFYRQLPKATTALESIQHITYQCHINTLKTRTGVGLLGLFDKFNLLNDSVLKAVLHRLDCRSNYPHRWWGFDIRKLKFKTTIVNSSLILALPDLIVQYAARHWESESDTVETWREIDRQVSVEARTST